MEQPRGRRGGKRGSSEANAGVVTREGNRLEEATFSKASPSMARPSKLKLGDAHPSQSIVVYILRRLREGRGRGRGRSPVPVSAPVRLCIVHCRDALGILSCLQLRWEDAVSNKDDPSSGALRASLGMGAGRSLCPRAGVIRFRPRGRRVGDVLEKEGGSNAGTCDGCRRLQRSTDSRYVVRRCTWRGIIHLVQRWIGSDGCTPTGLHDS